MEAAAPVLLRRVPADGVKALSLSPIDDATMAQAGAILTDVRTGGEAKLLEIAHKFGDMQPGASATALCCNPPADAGCCGVAGVPRRAPIIASVLLTDACAMQLGAPSRNTAHFGSPPARNA